MRNSKYTRELLAPIVAGASSVTDVIRRLGLHVTGGNWRYIRGRIRYLELDTRHFHTRISNLSRDDLVGLVNAHTSVAQVATALGLPKGGAQTRLKARIAQLAGDRRGRVKPRTCYTVGASRAW